MSYIWSSKASNQGKTLSPSIEYWIAGSGLRPSSWTGIELKEQDVEGDAEENELAQFDQKEFKG